MSERRAVVGSASVPLSDHDRDYLKRGGAVLLASRSALQEEDESDQVAVLQCLLRRAGLLAIVSMFVLLLWGVASGPTSRDATLSDPEDAPPSGAEAFKDTTTSVANNTND